jgi:hypothetical protein
LRRKGYRPLDTGPPAAPQECPAPPTPPQWPAVNHSRPPEASEWWARDSSAQCTSPLYGCSRPHPGTIRRASPAQRWQRKACRRLCDGLDRQERRISCAVTSSHSAISSPGATVSGRAPTYDFRPPHLPVAAFLRSRAALSFATSDVLSNCAIAPSTCRTSTAVGVSSVKKSGAVAGIREMPSDFRKSCPVSCTVRSRANRSGLSTMMQRTPSGVRL